MKNKIQRLVKKIKNGSYIKLTVIIFVMLFLLCGSVGETLAWMVCQTDLIINTFTYGKIGITLTEKDTKLDDDNDEKTNTYEIEPGETIIKDPTITVEAESEASWLFVKLEKSENFDQYLEYTMAEGWKLLDAKQGVYYREVGETDAAEGIEIQVLKDHSVIVKEEVDKEMLNKLNQESYPTLKITAYAVQKSTELETIDTAEEAWGLISPKSAE